MICHVAVVRTNVLERRITSIIRVPRISELGTKLAHGITSQKMAFFGIAFVYCVFPYCFSIEVEEF
jgi:hypothetical protein